MKEILLGNDIRLKLMEGIELLTNTVKITLGPKGKNVIIEKDFGYPLVTKDGVTVAKEVYLKDKFQNMGAQAIKEVASRTSDDAGDGTTTATILACSMIKEGLKYIASGSNPMDIKRGMERAIEESIKELNKLTKICKSNKEISQVASISANNDYAIGGLISKAVELIGKEGIITVEEGKSLENELEIVEGMQFDRGYISPYFINNSENQSCLLENAFILIYNNKLENINSIINVLDLVSKANRSLLIMAEEIDNDVLATLILNNLRGNLKLAAIKLPGFGEKRKDILEDIAILTGGTVINDETGKYIDDVNLSDLGQVRKIEIYKESTVLINGGGSSYIISQRIKNISYQLSLTNSEYDKEKLQERLSKLSNGIAVIRVGAATELEMKDKKARIEDALHATKAAIDEGVVPGGGVTLLRIKNLIKNLKGDNEDQTIGIKIISKAMEEPFKQLILNGNEEVGFILMNILNSDNMNYGYNVVNGKYGDLIEDGIMDPTKVTRTALQNASSIANLILTTDAGITNVKQKKTDINENEDDEDSSLEDMDV